MSLSVCLPGSHVDALDAAGRDQWLQSDDTRASSRGRGNRIPRKYFRPNLGCAMFAPYATRNVALSSVQFESAGSPTLGGAWEMEFPGVASEWATARTLESECAG